ncbi:hypothetical protein JCM3775_005937 [Rhodotorula graminis]|uniref:Uncharacterized protein n=1 Tax=Rhodotorula graminis (strain WP1) TaxID=578459 RepID=A0A194SCK3_RHOGW|nr:uncharacterized protein RHOBADRAFT_40890 [Rhodotorula graminis WP1]KPV78344.1 hypothetical protein RHOBADRAFT_40890 [Rhodotorula graminis WP1]
MVSRRLPIDLSGEPYPRRRERRLAIRLARKAHKLAKAERLLDARIKKALVKAGKKELAKKVALARRESAAASPSPTPLVRKRTAADDDDDDNRIANIANDVASTFKKRQTISMRKMALNLDERASMISSNVLAALASTAATDDKAVVLGQRKVVRLRKSLAAATTSRTVTHTGVSVNGVLEKVLTAIMNAAVETALTATLLALPDRAGPTPVLGNKFVVSWWTDSAKTTIAGLEDASERSSASPKVVDQDRDTPKPRVKSLFAGKAFAATSSDTIYGSSTPFAAAAAVGPAFSTQRSLTVEPTSFAAYFEASGLVKLSPTSPSTFLTLAPREIVAAVEDAQPAEVAPPLEPVVVPVTPPHAEDDKYFDLFSCSKLYKLVDGAWVYQGKGDCQLNEAMVARLVVRSGDYPRIINNVALSKLSLRGRDWARFTAFEGSAPVSYLMHVTDCLSSLKLVNMVEDKSDEL